MCSIEKKIPVYWWVSNFFFSKSGWIRDEIFSWNFSPFLMLAKLVKLTRKKNIFRFFQIEKLPTHHYIYIQYEYVNVYKFRWYGYWLLERPILLPTYLILRKISWNSVTIWFHEFFSAWILFLKNFPTLSLKTIQWYKHIFFRIRLHVDNLRHSTILFLHWGTMYRD